MFDGKNFFKRLRAAWHPDEYHGWGLRQRYFEGWYFKMIAPDGAAYAVIPGISLGQTEQESHAFIQVMDGRSCRAAYHRFEIDEFKPASGHFALQLGDNFFAADRLKVNLPDFRGEVRFLNRVGWPKMLGAPGIMGWYSFVPFMECNHGILSMDHQLDGVLTVSSAEGLQNISMSGGKGYIEKDWGRSFPKAYVWMQSNHFSDDGCISLMASVAHIPWLRSYFIGFISGFQLEKKLFRFATYTGARKYLRVEDQSLELVFRQRRQELRIGATQAPGVALISPLKGEMTGKINESLQARLSVELLEDGKRCFEGVGRNAGLEVVGNTRVLIH